MTVSELLILGAAGLFAGILAGFWVSAAVR